MPVKNTSPYSLLIVHAGEEASSLADAFDQWVLERGGMPGRRTRIELPDLLGFEGVVPCVEAVLEAQGVGKGGDEWLRTLPASAKVIGVLHVDRGMVHVTPSVPNYAHHFQQTMISMQDLLGAGDVDRLRYVGTRLLSGNAATYMGHQERLRVLHASQQLEEALPSEPATAPKMRF